MSDILDTIKRKISEGAVSLRFRDELEPTAGHGQTFQPPTYPAEADGSRYATWVQGLTDSSGEPRFENGQRLTTLSVLVDAEASQSNRAEEALASLVDEKILSLPRLELVVNAGEVPELNYFTGQRLFTNLNTPHREQDPIFRFALVSKDVYKQLRPDEDLSELAEVEPGMVPFARTGLGRSIITTSADDFGPLLRYAAPSLVYGFWHSYSTGQSAERPRLARRYSSTIVAHDAFPVRSSSVKAALFNEGNDIHVGASAADELLFDVFAPGTKDAGKASAVGAGAIPGHLGDKGFTAQRIDWISTISVRGLLAIPLGLDTTPEQRSAVAAALMILAVSGRAHTGLFLRSGCDLARVPGTKKIEWIMRDGTVELWDLDPSPQAIQEAWDQAKAELAELGGPIIGDASDTIRLSLSPGYRKLIDDSNTPKPIFKEA
ncbi:MULTISPECIES: type I-U CRISPR-associated protein Cas7 [Arthrobacter]|uniref:Type I-U CRISPR-associated protein Cas7 n=2 Tax=Arthrobacter TaxID=1663 RepID=A0ABU9KLR7_9MICC|nr:type I-U CRISPR-associated protein Cas7 [Arthrobacter sp. YJM1]MDP5228472.1 type I-U CRISPR-associated protein Cas7 [Arthrobacter sp. YJM1]